MARLHKSLDTGDRELTEAEKAELDEIARKSQAFMINQDISLLHTTIAEPGPTRVRQIENLDNAAFNALCGRFKARAPHTDKHLITQYCEEYGYDLPYSDETSFNTTACVQMIEQFASTVSKTTKGEAVVPSIY